MNYLIEKYALPQAASPDLERFRLQKVSRAKLTPRNLDPNDDNSVEDIAEAANQPVPDFAPDYQAAQEHAAAASYALGKARNASNDGNEGLAGAMVNHACSHLIHAHHALRGAAYSKEGDYLPAVKKSFDCIKALLLAKVALSSADLEAGRLAINQAIPMVGVVASALARARIAPELADVQQSTLLKCVVNDASPLCKMAGHW